MWNRVNDAIDTIIRRDESTETGPLLPPCVEGIAFASLTLVIKAMHFDCYGNCLQVSNLGSQIQEKLLISCAFYCLFCV